MPFVDSDGIRIHYKVIGDGPPLFLVHGLMGSHEDWIDNRYVELMKDNYKLILVDQRGHGLSDKPSEHEPYKLRSMTMDIVMVMDELDIQKTHYLGHSLGGYAGLGLTKYAPNRLNSLTVFSYGPYEPEHVNKFKGIWEGFFKQDKEFIISNFLSTIPDDAPNYYKNAMKKWADNYRNTGVAPYLAWCKIREQDDLTKAFPKVNFPCLFICGEEDIYKTPAKEISNIIPDSEYILKKKLTHADIWGRTDLILPHVKKFLEKNRHDQS